MTKTPALDEAMKQIQTCSVWIGTPGITVPRVRIDFAPNSVGTMVFFDNVKVPNVREIRMNAEAPEATELHIELITAPNIDAPADFLSYLSACGFTVMVRDLRAEFRASRQYPDDDGGWSKPT